MYRILTVLCDGTVVRADPMVTVRRAVCLVRRLWFDCVETSESVSCPVRVDWLHGLVLASICNVVGDRRHSRKKIPGEQADASFQYLENQAAASEQAVKAAGQ